MRFRILVAILAAALFIGSALAHDGHDHGDAGTLPTITGAAPRGEAISDHFELVAVVRGDTLDIFVDRFATNEPVEGAAIELETPSGPVSVKARPGQAYSVAAPWLSMTGKTDLIFTVTVGDTSEILPVSLQMAAIESAAVSTQPKPWVLILAAISAVLVLALFVFHRRSSVVAVVALIVLVAGPGLAHEGHDHAKEKKSPKSAVTLDIAQRQSDGSLFVPKAVQRIFGLRTIPAEQGNHYKSIELPGRIIPDPNASGYVQSAVGGRLSPPAGGFPRLGTRAKKGDVLAYLTPPLQAIDVSDMRQRQGEIDQQIGIVERRLKRFEELSPSGAIARSMVEDTQSELAGLRERRAMLDKSRREPEELQAPVSGVVADGSAVAGQIAQANSVVFQIVDPARLWVEALSFGVVSDTQRAFAQTATGKTVQLSPRGSGFADRNQSIPVHFAIEGENTDLRAGQFVTVLVRADEEQKGIVIPRSAIVRAGNGQDVVYEHISPERFQARIIRTAPFDGNNVIVFAGLESGVRIVTQGAELLGEVR